MSTYLKDPGEKLDYTVNWADFLAVGETIPDAGSSTWTVPSGLTNHTTSRTTTAATIWLSGGTHGEEYVVTNQITTSSGRIAERSIKLIVRSR